MNIKSILVFLFILGSLVSCKKEENKAILPTEINYTEYNVSINLVANDKPLKLGVYDYTNASKNNYSVTVLKFLLSHPTLIYDDGTADTQKIHLKCDIKDSLPTTFAVKVPKGKNLKAINLGFGVNPINNHSGAQEGALDPSMGMFWTWNTGYIFFMHEGNFITKDGSKKYLLFHYGTDQAYTRFNSILPQVLTYGKTAKISIQFDLNKMYEGISSTIDFNYNFYHQSTGVEDDEWMYKLRTNVPNAFSIKVE